MASKNMYLTTNAAAQPPIDLHIPVTFPGETPMQKAAGIDIPVFVSPVEKYPNMITIKRLPK